MTQHKEMLAGALVAVSIWKRRSSTHIQLFPPSLYKIQKGQRLWRRWGRIREKEGGAPLKQIIHTNLWRINGFFSVNRSFLFGILWGQMHLGWSAVIGFPGIPSPQSSRDTAPKVIHARRASKIWHIVLCFSAAAAAPAGQPSTWGMFSVEQSWAPLEKGILNTFPALPPWIASQMGFLSVLLVLVTFLYYSLDSVRQLLYSNLDKNGNFSFV